MPESKIIFSVITVTYNAQKHIERTIESVLEQTYDNVEYIIIDGDSTDSTVKIAKRYIDRIAKIISEPDKGLYHAMNKAFNIATGDFICFLNAGDTFYEKDTLIKVASLLNNNNNEHSLPDIIYGETAIVDVNGRFIRMRRLKTPQQLTWKSYRNGMTVCHQAFWVRTSIAERYNLNYRYSSDFDWCIRMAKKANRIKNTHLTLVYYLNEGLTTSNRWASLKERFSIMTKHFGLLSTMFHHVWFVIRLILRP